MFGEWLQLSVGLLVVGIICGVVMGGPDVILPLLIVGAVIYGLFHQAKGYTQADKSRQQRRRNRR
jgi:H+/Cl- antiporter ClcA